MDMTIVKEGSLLKYGGCHDIPTIKIPPLFTENGFVICFFFHFSIY